MTMPILYSFRRCPYAMRARWAILKTGKLVELREVDLRNKPQALTKVSRKATVPVLLTDNGNIIDESIDIMKWCLDKYTFRDIMRLNSHAENKEVLFLIDMNDNKFKFHIDRFKYSTRFPDEEQEYHLNSAKEILYQWNLRLKSGSKYKNR